MAKKVVVISDGMHSLMKSKSVQDGITLEETIENTLRAGVDSAVGHETKAGVDSTVKPAGRETPQKGTPPNSHPAPEEIRTFMMAENAKSAAIIHIEELEDGLGERPSPEEYGKVYGIIKSLEEALRTDDYQTIKTALLEADPGWKEWMPPASNEKGPVQALNRIHVSD